VQLLPLGGVGYGTGSAHAYTPVGIAGQVLQSAAGAPIWKTLEMTDIPGAAYKATVVLLRQQILPRFQGF
jgi:hypothetical protein